MRITRILAATALTLLSALALTATANAEHEEPVTNHEEPMEVSVENGGHCSDILKGQDPGAHVDEVPDNGGEETTGGCGVSASGELRLRGHLFGIEQTISDCENQFSGVVDEEGEGWVTEATLSDHLGVNDCTLIPCPETNHMMRAWPIHVREDTGPTGPQEWIAAEFCVENAPPADPNRRECEVEFPVIVDTHDYSINGEALGDNHLNALNCEVDGSGEVATGQIELEHKPPLT